MDSHREFQGKMNAMIITISQMLWNDLAQNIDHNIHKRDEDKQSRKYPYAEWSEADLV